MSVGMFVPVNTTAVSSDHFRLECFFFSFAICQGRVVMFGGEEGHGRVRESLIPASVAFFA